MTFTRSMTIGNGATKIVYVRMNEEVDVHMHISQFEGGKWRFSDKLAYTLVYRRGYEKGFDKLKRAKFIAKEQARLIAQGHFEKPEPKPADHTWL